jgi:hypothetical protein
MSLEVLSRFCRHHWHGMRREPEYDHANTLVRLPGIGYKRVSHDRCWGLRIIGAGYGGYDIHVMLVWESDFIRESDYEREEE